MKLLLRPRPPSPHLAQRLFNVPLAVASHKAEVIDAALADPFGMGGMLAAMASSSCWPRRGAQVLITARHVRECGYDAGIAVIRVQGTLAAQLGELRPFSGTPASARASV